MAKKQQKRLPRRLIRNLPSEYLEAVQLGQDLFSPLFQFENGLRLAIHNHLEICYGNDWWEISLKAKLRDVYDYADNQRTRHNLMPWIGDSARVHLLPIHQVTLGQLEKIVRSYRSDCIPELFPTLEFFIGHMDVIKKVRNMFAHMFPCITNNDCRTAKREIQTMSSHVSTKL